MSERVRNVALATAAVAAAGGALALKHEAPSEQPDKPVEGGAPKVAYVMPNNEVNNTFEADGKTYRWSTPASDRTVEIAEDGHGGLKAELSTEGVSNPIDMDIHLPAKGTQAESSPQQAEDPTTSVEMTLPEPVRWSEPTRTTVDGRPLSVDHYLPKGARVDIKEDGEGGLQATADGGPVKMDLQLPTSRPDAPSGAPEKNGNLAPAPPAIAPGPDAPPNGTLHVVK